VPHAPSAGVDVEPNFIPPVTDLVTGGLAFVRCTFQNSLGAQFAAANARAIESITITGSNVLATMPDVSPGAFLNVAKYAITEMSNFTLTGAVAQTASVTMRVIYDADYAVISEMTFRGNSFVATRALAFSGANKSPVPATFAFNEVQINRDAPDWALATFQNFSAVACNSFFISGGVFQPSVKQQSIIDYTNTARVFQNAYQTDLNPQTGALVVQYGGVQMIDAEDFQSLALASVPPAGNGPYLSTLPSGAEAPSCVW
jgi:hypothetical protein